MKLSIKPKRSGKAEFLTVFNRAFDETVQTTKSDPARLYNLRCSQLPYCPASVLINWGQRGMFFAMSMSMAFYVGVGHAVHKVLQDYLAQSGQFIADYKCHECGKKYPLSRQHECCGFPTEYDEVEINVKSKHGRIIGHIDGIFVDSFGRVWIVDYKTSSLAGAPLKVKRAPEGYKRQVRAYAYLIKKQYGITVEGCMLVYIPRDNPKKVEVWEHKVGPEELKEISAELIKDLKLHSATMVAKTVEELLKLAKNNCGGEYCDACKMGTLQKKKLFTKFVKQGKYPIKKD